MADENYTPQEFIGLGNRSVEQRVGNIEAVLLYGESTPELLPDAETRAGKVFAYTINGTPGFLDLAPVFDAADEAEVATVLATQAAGAATAATVEAQAAINAMSPIFLVSPPTSEIDARPGQLVIVPPQNGIVISGPLIPDITQELIAWRTGGDVVEKVWYSSGGVDPTTRTDEAISIVVKFTNIWQIEIYRFGVVSPFERWTGLNGQASATPDACTSWTNIGTTGQPVIALTDEVPARSWINMAPPGAIPDWQPQLSTSGSATGQIPVADSTSSLGYKWTTIITGAGVDSTYNSLDSTLLFSLTPDPVVIFAGNGAFIGSLIQVTGGLPVIYHEGDFAPIEANEGDTIIPYKLVVNGIVTGDWFVSELIIPSDVDIGDVIAVTDSAGHLSNELVVEIEDPIGVMFNRTNFVDFSGMETNSGFSVSGGKLLALGTSDTSYARLATASALDSYKVTMTAKMTASDPDNYGLSVHIKSINPSVNNGLIFYVFGRTGTADYGKIVIYDEFAAVSRSGPFVPGFAVGVDVTYVVEKTSTHYIFTATTSFGSVSMSVPLLYTSGSGDISNNTFKVSLSNVDTATYEITQLKFESAMNKGGVWAIGDSITAGYNAASAQARWATRANARIQAGPGDKTSDVLNRLPEIINFAQPDKVLLMIGTNNTNDSTYHSELASIVSQLEAASIEVVVMTPPARNGADMSGYRDYIATTYPDQFIDIYSATKAAASSNLKNSFNTDGVHLNAAGHAAIATAAISS